MAVVTKKNYYQWVFFAFSASIELKGKYEILEPTIQLSRPLTSLWLLSKRISCIMLQPCVWQSLQRILGVFVIHPTQKFQVVMVVAIKEMTGRKSVKIHWNLN